MTKGTKTIQCERCEGKGEVCDYEVGSGGQHMWQCGACLGKGCVEQEVVPPDPSFSRAIAMLTSVIPKIPYADRKRLETEISDALFKGEVTDKEAWEKVVDTLRLTEDA